MNITILISLILFTSLVQGKSISSYLDVLLQSNDICTNGGNCYLKQNIRIKNANFEGPTYITLKEPIECPCVADFKYECTANWCAKSKEACHSWKKKLVNKQIENDTLDSLPMCNNGNLTIKANLFNYKLRFKR